METIQCIMYFFLSLTSYLNAHLFDSFDSHSIKWVFKNQSKPIILKTKINQEHTYGWFKYSENKFIDEDRYISFSLDNEAFLQITNYTNDDISFYAVLPIQDEDSMFNDHNKGDLFELVYFESLFIDVVDLSDRLQAYCIASFLLPNNNENPNDVFVDPSFYIMSFGDSNQVNSSPIKRKNFTKTRKDTLKSGKVPGYNFVKSKTKYSPITLLKTDVYNSNDSVKKNISCQLNLFELEYNKFVHVHSEKIYKEVNTAVLKAKTSTPTTLGSTKPKTKSVTESTTNIKTPKLENLF